MQSAANLLVMLLNSGLVLLPHTVAVRSDCTGRLCGHSRQMLTGSLCFLCTAAAGRGQWAEVPGPDTDMLAAEAGPGSGSAAGAAGAGGARTAGRRRGHNTGAQAGSRLGDGEAAGMADSRERSVPPELQEASITGGCC